MFLTGLRKNYGMGFHETWSKDGAWAKKEPKLNFGADPDKVADPRICFFFNFHQFSGE